MNDLDRMVDEQIVARGVRDPRVLAALRKVPRQRFVSASLAPVACADHPLPIGHGQTISQPYIVALMTEALRLKPGEKVLEVGTGSGYQAAVLAELGARVFSVELVPELARAAADRLAALGYDTVTCRCGDGHKGWPEAAPFDAILVAAHAPEAPPDLLEQLNKDGGRLIMPVGGPFVQELRLFRRHGDRYAIDSFGGCRFVPLVRGDGAQ